MARPRREPQRRGRVRVARVVAVGYPTTMSDVWRFHCGTYTTMMPHVAGSAAGIETFALDPDSGGIAELSRGPDLRNPSFLCASADGNVLYAVEEVEDYDAQGSGSIRALERNATDGRLEPRHAASSSGAGPAYLSLDRSGTLLLVANYAGGTVAVRRVAGPRLGDVTSVHTHRGSGPDAARQEGPHPHCFVASPCNRFAYAPDLGLDRVVAYELDAVAGTTSPRPDLDVATPPGSGPRHLAFDDDGGAVLVLELSSEIASYRFDEGRLVACDRTSTLPHDFRGANLAAEVRIGRHCVYVSNRGHDSIAAFARSARGGLEPTQWVGSGGRTPRNFALAPDQRLVVVANQDSSDLVSFSVDRTGALTPTGHRAAARSPAFVLFAPPLS